MDEEKIGVWRWKQSLLLLLVLITHSSLVSGKQLSSAATAMAATEADHQALKAVKLELVDPRGALSSWNTTRAEVCSTWAGIKCLNGRVIAVQLPWKGLEGRISDRIGLLRGLQHLSLHDNALTGPIPPALGCLPQLRGLYLFNNRLSGSIPPTFGNCLNLQILDLSTNHLTSIVPPSLGNCSRLYKLNLSHNKIVGNIPDELGNLLKLRFLDLSNNEISGDFDENLSKLSSLQMLNLRNNNLDGLIPPSIGKLGNLSVLDLSNNTFKGQIPVSLVSIRNLSAFDVSYNDLSGAVPSVLAARFNSSSFIGNAYLCGYSSSTTCPTQEPQNLPSSPSRGEEEVRRHGGRNLRTRDIILIAAGGALVVVLLITCCVLLCCLVGRNAVMEARKEKRRGGGEVESGGEVGGKLVHFDGPLVFAADDLLCASAEIMGKSAYGTAYRATMEDCNQVAVKRLREKKTKTRKEFEIEVAQLGRIRHPNVLPLRAYYIGPKGEKLLVYDYMPRGSLASFVHARGPETSIPWPTRMAIALGIARGLSHLHGDENLVHGNLTSSNILVDEQSSPMIADVGLSRLMTPDAASTTTSGSGGYRAPELAKMKDAGTKSDVYSLGVIMLELLTGKSPREVCDGLDLELPQWVASIVKEEWTNEVFDVELMRDAPDIGEELLNVLKLALHCVDPSPEARPHATDVLQKLEELKLDSIRDESYREVEENETLVRNFTQCVEISPTLS